MNTDSTWFQNDALLLGELRKSNRAHPPAPAMPGYADLCELNRGGQGVVYTAVQRSTSRRVAIKVLHGGAAGSPAARRRFERELDLLAGLRHPNLVRVYDGGVTDDGWLYYVMEFIEGKPFDEFCAGRSRRDALRAFADICAAVNHAHQRGVIHRDLKPGNIRVNNDGVPFVLDFGLAKLVQSADDASHAAMSRSGEFVGSLRWASPEQAMGDPQRIDIRTDVYSLGVILYQLVTGRFPYDVSGGLHAALDNIVHAEPTPPRNIRRDVNDELETILLKSLSKQPDRRYQIAGELGEDIRRHLAGAPIQAKRDSTLYTLRKTLRRHRLIVSAACVLMIAITTFAVTVSFMYQRATEAERAERDARLSAQQEASKATQIRDFVESILAAVDPETARGRDVTLLRELLDDASRRVETELSDQPLVGAYLGNVLGKTYTALGVYPEARAHLEAALSTHRRLLGHDDPLTLESAQRLGVVMFYQDEFPGAEALLRDTHDRLRRVLGPDAEAPLKCASDLGMVLKHQGRFEEAATIYRQTLDRQRALLGDDHPSTLSTLGNFSLLQFARGNLTEALAINRDVYAANRRTLGEEHPKTMISLQNLAQVLSEMGNLEEAEGLMRENLDTRRRVLGIEHLATLHSANNLAHLLQRKGDVEEALSLFEKCYDVRRRTLGEEHSHTLLSLNNLSGCYRALGRTEEAVETATKALEVRRRVLGTDTLDTAISLNNLGSLVREMGALEEALGYATEAVAVARRVLPEGHWIAAAFRGNLGDCLTRLERFEEAEAELLGAYEDLLTAVGEDHEHTTNVRKRIVTLYERWGRPDRAARYLRGDPP